MGATATGLFRRFRMYRWMECLITRFYRKGGPGTQVTGNPTNQACGADRAILAAYL